MSKRHPKLLLEDILWSIEKIEEYTSDLDFNSFFKSELVKDAVVRNIEIIGEASNRIPEELKELSENIPWQKLRGI